MAWYNPLSWTKYIPQVVNETINGTPVRASYDILDDLFVGTGGGARQTHYPDSFRKYVTLQENVFVVNDAIGNIAKYLSRANFSSENDNDRLLDKLNKPNQKQSKEEFLKEFAIFTKACGWSLIWKRYNGTYGDWNALELINVNPDKCDFSANGESLIFEHEGKAQTIKRTEFIIFYDSVKQKDDRGYSKLKPLRSQISNIIDGQKAKGIQIRNSGTTIVSPKVSQNANTVDEGLDKMSLPEIQGQKTQKQLIEEKLNFGIEIDNRIVVASRGLDALNLAEGLNNFDFDAKNEADILAIYNAFGTPVELTPYGKNNTYDNKKVAELSLIQSEVQPLAKSLVSSLISEFPDKGQPKVDFNDLEAMSLVQERIEKTNTEKINQVVMLMNAGLIDSSKGKQMLNGIIPE